MYIANNYGTWLNKERREGDKTIKFLQGLQSKSKATKLVKYIVKGKCNSVVGEAKTFEQEILLMVVINTYPPPSSSFLFLLLQTGQICVFRVLKNTSPPKRVHVVSIFLVFDFQYFMWLPYCFKGKKRMERSTEYQVEKQS